MHLHVLFVSFSFMLRLIFFADCAKPYLISVFEDLKLNYALLMDRCVSEDLVL